MCAADLFIGDWQLRLCSFYRPPSGLASVQSDYLRSACLSMASLIDSSPRFLLYTDANLPNIDWTIPSGRDALSRSFVEFSANGNLAQLVSSPTREKHCLDLILTNVPDIVAAPMVCESRFHSDHCEITTTILSPSASFRHSPSPLRRNFRKADWPAFRSFLADINWDALESVCSDPTELCWFILSIIGDGIERFVPSRAPLDGPPPLPPSLRSLKQAVGRLRRRPAAQRTVKQRKSLCILSGRLRRALRLLWRRRDAAVLSSPAGLFRLMAATLGKKASRVPSLVLNGAPVPAGKDTAEAFADQFAAVYRTPTSAPPDLSLPPTFPLLSNVYFSRHSVLKVINRLAPKLSSGLDGIPALLIKSLADVLCYPLARLFRLSLIMGQPPDQFLPSVVTPVYKRKGPISSPASYRPVGVVSSLGKCFEAQINIALVAHCESNGIFHPSQFGFRRGRSREALLIEFLDFIRHVEGHTVTAYTDFSAAFDRFSLPHLFVRLREIGIDGPLMKILEAFLPFRSARVKVGGALSEPYPLLSGAVQGSSLSTTLFLIYINPLISEIESSGCRVWCYADDLRLTAQSPTVLQSGLDIFHNWCLRWEMSAQPSKCFVLAVDKSPSVPLTLMGVPLPTHSDRPVRDLGFLMTSSLDFSHHIDQICSRARALINLLFRSLRSATEETYISAYEVYVRSLMESGSVVYGSAKESALTRLDRVQRYFTHRLCRRLGRPRAHFSARNSAFGLHTLKSRRFIADLCFVHASFSGHLKCDGLRFARDSPDMRLVRHHRLLSDQRPSAQAAGLLNNRIAFSWNALSPSSVNVSPSTFRSFCVTEFGAFAL